MNTSPIEWTDATWNPSTGCDKVSSGCAHCYAETLAARLKAMGSSRYRHGFAFTIHPDKIDEPTRWKKPRRIFVNSMSDLFHEHAPYEFVRQVFQVMAQAKQHQYQILTKRPDRMAEFVAQLQAEGVYNPSRTIWLGTSVENANVVSRVDYLRGIPAGIRFLSCEPLLGPLGDIDLTGIHWVIAGGESGIHLWDRKLRERRGLVDYVDGAWVARGDRVQWVTSLRDAANKQGTAFFFKQWGAVTPKAGGRRVEGRTWDEYPAQLETSDSRSDRPLRGVGDGGRQSGAA